VRIGQEAGQALANAITQKEAGIANLHCVPELVVRASSARFMA
jgi:LacI family transcriptional regulator